MTEVQPNSLDCFVCGVSNPFGLKLKFYQTDHDEVIVNCSIPGKYQGYPGAVHGGIIAAILDEASGRVYMGNAEKPRLMYTARLTVRYRKKVPTGTPLRIVGRAGKDRGRTATAIGEIYNEAGELLAESKALLVDVPENVFDKEDLVDFGWKVYPELS